MVWGLNIRDRMRTVCHEPAVDGKPDAKITNRRAADEIFCDPLKKS